MDFCPHCGAPGSTDGTKNARCPICGMVASAETLMPDAFAEADEAAPVQAQRDASTPIPPKPPVPDEQGTVAYAERAPDPYDTDLPKAEDLIKPRELSPEYARRVTAAWEQTHSQYKDPCETIKVSNSAVDDVGELNIGHRTVGRIEEQGEHDYDLTEVIGEGAMGAVWSARQTSLDRDVAIKMPKGSAAKSEFGRRQFMSEVVVTGQLDHPNIVPIYELGKDSSGGLFYSMKRVEGRAWNELLEERELNQQENLEILMKVCDAIRFAHDRGVIHRDIKPHNVMVGQYGEVSVMDWGIALRLDEDTGDARAAKISPAGTPAYMAPEMATGAAGDIGPATDVYLLGAVLYEILTGEPPHPPPTDSRVQLQILQEALLIAARNEITPITQGGELNQIACRAMATDVGNRYQSVDNFQDAIRDYLSHAESINLTERGEKLLERAKRNGHAKHDEGGRFDDFDRARFAFEEALAIWPGNKTAQKSSEETLLAYANYAYDEGAYARGIALLDEANPDHTRLLRKLQKARRRTSRLSFMLKAALALIFVGGSAFSFFLYQAWSEADKQRLIADDKRQEAETQRSIAEDKKKEADEQRLIAEGKKKEADEQRLIAEDKKKEADEQRLIAEDKKKEADEQRLIAEDKKKEADQQRIIAERNEKSAERSSYAFEIGLAAEELQRNAFDRAQEILTSQAESEAKSPLRHWEWGHLKSLVSLDAESYNNGGKLVQGRIEATAISDNGEWIAAGAGSGDVHLWRSDRPQRPVRLRYGETVHAVAITSDGSMLLVAGREAGGQHAIKAWTLPAREAAAADRELAAQAAPILSLDLSSDSERVIAGTANGDLLIARVDGKSQFKRFPVTAQENRIWSVRFSTDEKWIVTAGEDGTVRVWDATSTGDSNASPREVKRIEGHEGPVYTAEFAPDGSYVVSGGRDRQILAAPFDAKTASQSNYSQVESVRLRLSKVNQDLQSSDTDKIGEHNAAVRSISFSEEGNILYSAGHDHTVRVWDVSAGAAQAELKKTLRGHGGWVRSCVAIAGQPNRVLSGGYDRRIRIWNWQNYRFPLVLKNNSSKLGELQLTAGAASSDGVWLAAASANGTIAVWDMSKSESPTGPDFHELSEGHDWQATTAQYFQDGQRLLTAGGDNTALVWDANLGNEIVRMGGRNAKVGSGWRGLATATIDGRWIATGATNEILARIWNAKTGAVIAVIPVPNAKNWLDEERPEATALAFSPDGKFLAIADQWGSCYLANAENNWDAKVFRAHESKISAAKFLPDGNRFLTASYDGTVNQWNANSENDAAEATFLHADRVVAMDVSRDGRKIITAAGSEDDEAIVRIWNLAKTDRPEQRLRLTDIGGDRSAVGDKNAMIRSVAFHPNEPIALVTIFDPRDSSYHVGKWSWEKTNNPYRLVPTGDLRDVSTALFTPGNPDTFLTVGGRGARLRKLAASASPVSMTYRPQTQIMSISFSANGEKLISAGKDGSLKMWALDVETRRWLPEAKLVGEHEAAINSVTFHPTDSNTFLTTSDDGTARLWRLQTGRWLAVQTMKAPEAGAVNDAAFLLQEDGSMQIVTGGASGAYLWEEDEDTPQLIHRDGSVCCCVAPSPKGNLIAVATGRKVTLYNTKTLQPLTTLSGHSEEITSVAFTPDGSRLFTASRDYTVRLWRTPLVGSLELGAQQRELLTLEGHTDEVTSVIVAEGENQTFVLTTALDGQAIVWPSVGP